MKRYLIKKMCFSPWGTPAAVRRAKAPTNEVIRYIAGIELSRIQTAGLLIYEEFYERYKAQFDKAEDDGLIEVVPIEIPEESSEAPEEPVVEEPEVVAEEPSEAPEEPVAEEPEAPEEPVVEEAEEPVAEEPEAPEEPVVEEPAARPRRRGGRK